MTTSIPIPNILSFRYTVPMLLAIVPSVLLFIFGAFNLLGIKKELLPYDIIYFFVGIIGFFIVKIVKPQFFKLNSRFFYWFFVITLIVTYIVGAEVKGSRRWMDLLFFRFQPSEFFKIFFIIFLATLFSKPLKSRMFTPPLAIYLKALGYFILPTIIILKQPDLGSAMVFVFIFFTMCWFSDIPKKYLFYSLLIVLLTLPLQWFFMHDYQRDRILSFISPHGNQGDTSYNMIQAIITIGSGQIAGRGLGLGKQSQLFFLPEFHTDFAFASLVEQFGFVGGFIVIVLYMFLGAFVLRKILSLYNAQGEQNRFTYFYAIGFFAFLIFQIFVNIGMNLGMLPIAGITLPLISYGGSSLITFWLGLAFLL